MTKGKILSLIQGFKVQTQNVYYFSSTNVPAYQRTFETKQARRRGFSEKCMCAHVGVSRPKSIVSCCYLFLISTMNGGWFPQMKMLGILVCLKPRVTDYYYGMCVQHTTRLQFLVVVFIVSTVYSRCLHRTRTMLTDSRVTCLL